MSAKRLTLAILTWALIGPAAAQSVPSKEPVQAGEALLAGRLPFGLTALSTGELLAPDEDKSITVLDAHARILASWRAPDRFAAPLSAAPAGPRTLVAAPLLSGQIVVLVWDPQTRVLAPSYIPARASEASAAVWTSSGTLLAGWKDGRVEAWKDGSRVWSASAGMEIRCLLVDNAAGVFAFGPGGAALFDFTGRPINRWTLDGTPAGALQSIGGTVVCWTEAGVWRLDASGFIGLASGPVLGAALDGQGGLIVTEPARVRRLRLDGTLLSQIVLPRLATSPAVIDDRGRFLIGTSAGLEEWTYDGRLLARLSGSQPSRVLLTESGIGAWGTADWKVHVWSGFQWPEYGWPQEGGDSLRSYAARRSAGVQERASRWTEAPAFTYLYLLASSSKEADQSEALDRIEAAAVKGDALWQAPWLDVVLLKIARSGLTDLSFLQGKVANSFPNQRLRAFRLLALTASPEDRDELLALVHKEYEPAVLTAAIRALTRSGWDGDGALMRMLDETLRRSDDPALAETIVDAARTLWRRNGSSSDPVLVPLVQYVFQGAYPTSVKRKAQKFFQELLNGL